jgi:hypothetical protein
MDRGWDSAGRILYRGIADVEPSPLRFIPLLLILEAFGGLAVGL